MEINTITEFKDIHDDDVCDYWEKLNHNWLRNNRVHEEWIYRRMVLDDYHYGGGVSDGNLESCWNDEHPTLGYEFCANAVAKEKNIIIVPDLEGVEWDGEKFNL